MNLIYKWLLNAAKMMKPVLVHIIPINVLRNVKRKVISNSLNNLWETGKLPYKSGYYDKGINLIGNIKAETGLGQSCRLVASVLEETEYPLNIYQYSQLGIQRENDTTYDDRINTEPVYDVNLIHINPHEMPLAYVQMDKSVWDYRYNIAYWLWELEEFPDEWVSCFNYLDEIWAPSEFICEAVRKKTELPVRCIPYHVTANIEKEYSRADFGLPEDKFLYLMMYDNGSCMERKNPAGVIEAFKKAFSPAESEAGLVIKINNPSVEDETLIHNLLKGYENVFLIGETLERSAVNSLIKCADVLVSLHRAEGFGLVMAEAMLLGTPVTATNWSANVEFMNEETACLVDYEFAYIKEDISLYRAGNRWAEPDINQAAMYMRKLYEDKEFYNEISMKGQSCIKERLSMDNAVQAASGRLDEIYEELGNKRENDRER